MPPRPLYDADEVKRRVTVRQYLADRGEPITSGNRFRAIWRGGDGPSGSFDPGADGIELWYDHKGNLGGTVIDLCMAWEGLDFPKAVAALAERFGVPASGEIKPRPGAREFDRRYDYTDADGALLFWVTRWKNPKGFSQGCPANPRSIEGVETVLYRLPAVLAAETVYVAEGEKDAETLVALGVCGTTAPMGAGKWKPQYTEALRGKAVVVVPDNDAKGREHERLVLRALKGAARSVRVLRVPAPHKDISDWAAAGNGAAEFAALSEQEPTSPAPTSPDAAIDPAVDPAARAAAKAANAEPFRNTVSEEVPGQNGRPRLQEVPIPVNDLVADIHARFLNFPRLLGDEQLFDHDLDTGRIAWIATPSDLEAWIGSKSKNTVHIARVSGAVSLATLLSALRDHAVRYDAVAHAPWWPARPGVYLADRDAYAPSEGHVALDGLLDFFSPADDASRILLRTLVATPLWFVHKVQRPCWVVDSADGPGAGKTTLVDLVAHLYRCIPIKTSQYQLRHDYDELQKNILSASGRLSRILLVDNVSGDFDEPRFAALVTEPDFSGRPAYGRGQETRANDISCFITVNNAQLSREIADRAYTVILRHPEGGPSLWKERVLGYIDSHRPAILGDIMDILSNPPAFELPLQTRMPEFEKRVLHPMCGTSADARAAIDGIMATRQSADIEREAASVADDYIAFMLQELAARTPGFGRLDEQLVFIRSEAVVVWMRERRISMDKLRQYITAGLVPHVVPGRDRFPFSSVDKSFPRRRGILWRGSYVTAATWNGRMALVGLVDAKTIGVVQSDIQAPSIRDSLPAEPVAAPPVPAPAEPQEPEPVEILPF